MSLRYEGKVAIVTGGAQGIGAAIVRRLVSEGCKVTVADMDAAKLDELGAELGDSVMTCVTNVTVREQVQEMVDKTVARFGKLDVLFANAGILTYAPFLEESEDAVMRLMDVNVKGCFLCGQIAARQMVAQGNGGVIVNTASSASQIVTATTAGYAASKGAVMQLTKVMGLELAEHNIRVNCFGPGSVRTRMTEKTRANDAKRERIMAGVPMHRYAEPEEIAAVACFLGSDDSSYMTGEIVFVDGGWKIQ